MTIQEEKDKIIKDIMYTLDDDNVVLQRGNLALDNFKITCIATLLGLKCRDTDKLIVPDVKDMKIKGDKIMFHDWGVKTRGKPLCVGTIQWDSSDKDFYVAIDKNDSILLIDDFRHCEISSDDIGKTQPRLLTKDEQAIIGIGL